MHGIFPRTVGNHKEFIDKLSFINPSSVTHAQFPSALKEPTERELKCLESVGEGGEGATNQT